MADYKLHFRHLTKRVTLDKEPITYRLFAREFGIDVEEAKTIMKAYTKEQQAIDRKVVPSWLVSGFLKESEKKKDEMEVDGVTNGEADVIKEEKEDLKIVSRASSSNVPTRLIKVVKNDELESTLALFISPSSHIYSLSPDGSASQPLSHLTVCSIASVPESARAKWKNVEGVDYGTHKNPEGERRKKVDKKGKGKEVAASVPAPKKTTSTSSSTTTDKKPSTSKSTTASTSKESKPSIRPMGQLGGLFARAAEVPKKRKASPPPAAKKTTNVVKKQNGIFEDDFDDEDEEMDEEAEKAMREMEEAAAAKGKGKKKDDGMEVDPPAKSKAAPPKKEEPKMKAQGSLNGFFKKG